MINLICRSYRLAFQHGLGDARGVMLQVSVAPVRPILFAPISLLIHTTA